MIVAGIYFLGHLPVRRSGRDRKETGGRDLHPVHFIGVVLEAGYEQAGSFFNLFAERHTVREAAWLSSLMGWTDKEIPTSWFQSLEPIFVIALAPVVAGIWVCGWGGAIWILPSR